MEIKDLLKAKNAVVSEGGEMIGKYLSDAITELSTSNIDGNVIKGMCMLLNTYKNIPVDYENLKGVI